MQPPVVNVGLLGVGTVGAAVARELAERRDLLIARTGCEFRLVRALVRRLDRERGWLPPEPTILTRDPAAVLDDPSIEVVIEAIGGEEPAFDYLSRALKAGKRVVTANKEVIAKRGPELQALADRHAARLRFEAAVGGGIPLMASLRQLLPINRVEWLRAIVNGTTNYMLTEMARGGQGYAEALAQAQALGYAEPDPTADVEGIDAAYKLAILASLCFGRAIHPDTIARRGITELGAEEIAYARRHGLRLKLIASGRRIGGNGTPDGASADLELAVQPTFLAADDPLGSVDGALNAIELGCDLAGPIRLVGAGAGPGPTASALIGDAVRAMRETGGGPTYPQADPAAAAPAGPTGRYYLRIQATAENPALLAALAELAAPGVGGDAGGPRAGSLETPVLPAAELAERLTQLRAIEGVGGVAVVALPEPAEAAAGDAR